MFTGLVQELGVVADIARNETNAVITIKAAQLAGQIKPGDSVSVDGVCLTAVAVASDSFTADVMVQTLGVTSLGQIVAGSQVNLELAARLDTRMGGHIVQGHVDGTGTLVGTDTWRTVDEMRSKGRTRIT
jgi:riboflavin synthase